MRTAILAALALHEQTRGMTTYSVRKRWLADTRLGRGDRTAERRIEESLEAAAARPGDRGRVERRRGQSDPDDDGWYIDHFSAVFMLDGDAPEAIEHRRIVATRHQLTEIALVLDTPRESGQRRLGLKADVISGGTLLRAEELSKNRTRYIIRLPHPLQPDQTHEYEMHIRVAADEPMRDYYVFRPERRCDGFDLRVRFDRRHPPRWVRQVTGEDVHVYYPYDGAPAPFERVPVDATGEAHAAFAHPRPHLGYGLQWSSPRTHNHRRPPAPPRTPPCPAPRPAPHGPALPPPPLPPCPRTPPPPATRATQLTRVPKILETCIVSEEKHAM